MAALRQVRRCGITFDIYSKSITVTCQQGTENIFLGREPVDKDIDVLCGLIEIGPARRTALVQETLDVKII